MVLALLRSLAGIMYPMGTTLVALLWFMGISFLQLTAWIRHQAVTAWTRLEKLGSVVSCWVQLALVHLLNRTMCAFRGVSEAVAVAVGLRAGREMLEAMDVRMKALSTQLEATRRDLEEVQRKGASDLVDLRREAEMKGEEGMGELRRKIEEKERELAMVKGELVERMSIGEHTLGERVEAVRENMKDSEQKRAVEMKEIRGTVQEWEKKLAAVKGELDNWTTILQHVSPIHQRINSALKGTTVDLKNLTNVTDAILGYVSTMTHLKVVELDKSSGFTTEGVKQLYKLPKLEKLNLLHIGIPDNALEGIGSASSLTNLDITNTKVTDAGLLQLVDVVSLKLLILDCKGVTNAGMEHVGKLTNLETLSLEGTAVTDAGLKPLTALTKLSALWLPNGEKLCNDDVRKRLGM
ncbi:unnamed protein product [Closterium sp. Yama58-4]|nr:unnamed protein product [Closterium sp. Yama58-4]